MPFEDDLDSAPALAAAAARLVIEEGLEYGAAKHKAARAAARHGAHRPPLPSNEQIEDAVREELALFHSDEQPGELQALRRLALRWMERLAPHRPHLAGAAWRGTATRRSALHLDLYGDDPKGLEIELLNQGVDFDAADAGSAGGDGPVVLSLADRCDAWPEPVTLHLALHDHDDLRGALKPDARGRSWRGDTAALRRLLAQQP